MSNRIDRRFEALTAAGRKALIPFMTAGDPSPEWTVSLMHQLVACGADLLELGVPFSDPTADGPVIQAASERAIGRGVSLARVIGMVARFRERDSDTPVVLMGYMNPVERYGHARFAVDAAQAGVDGILTVDCPPEEMQGLRRHLDKAGVYPICLVAPTTGRRRKQLIAGFAAGFVYYVSFKGITGADRLEAPALREPLREVREFTRLPLVVGFGVKDAEGARAVAEHADGVVIGSALVDLLAKAQSEQEAQRSLAAFVAPIRQAMDNTACKAKATPS